MLYNELNWTCKKHCNSDMALNSSCYLFSLLLLCVIVATSASYGYDTYQQTPRSKGKEPLPPVFSVQGIIYCKSGPKTTYPLKGAVVRISCLGIDKNGYEMSPFSLLTRPTDGNGYFLAKLTSREDDGCKVSQCKAFLHSSPLKSCQFATDTNKGLSGAPISEYRTIGSNMRLYSLPPFVYTYQAQPALIGY